MNKNVLLSSVFLSFFLGSLPPLSSAQESIIDLIQRSKGAIVGVKAVNVGVYKSPEKKHFLIPQTGRVVTRQSLIASSRERHGAGVTIDPSGIVVTNGHIIYLADKISIVLENGAEIPARLIRYVGNLDFALLKIDAPFPLTVIPIGDSDRVHLGDEIITVGNSELLKESISGGRVIGIGQSKNPNPKNASEVDLIQMNINVYRGDSGGPVFNKDGELIGLMTAKETSNDRSCFAIPSKKILNELNSYRKKAPGN